MHVCKVMTTNLYEILIESFFFVGKWHVKTKNE